MESIQLKEVSKTILGDSAEFVIVSPRDLVLLKKNARYFKRGVYTQLVENLKKDKRLSSVPLCYKNNEGSLEVLSGNHRVKASVDAGIEKIMVMVVLGDLSNAKKIAIQLSHNAIVGEDDARILSELWGQIEDVKEKLYAGLSSEVLDTFKKADLVTFSTPAVATKTISFVFTDSELERLDAVMAEMSNISCKDKYLFDMNQFDQFFNKILAVKKADNVKTGSLAMVHILEVLEEKYNQIQ